MICHFINSYPLSWKNTQLGTVHKHINHTCTNSNQNEGDSKNICLLSGFLAFSETIIIFMLLDPFHERFLFSSSYFQAYKNLFSYYLLKVKNRVVKLKNLLQQSKLRRAGNSSNNFALTYPSVRHCICLHIIYIFCSSTFHFPIELLSHKDEI